VAEVLANRADGLEKDLKIAQLSQGFPEFRGTLDQIWAKVINDYKTGDIHQDSAVLKPSADAAMDEKKAYLDYKALSLIEGVIKSPLEGILTQIQTDFPTANCCSLNIRMLRAATYLIERIPPVQLLGEQAFDPPNWFSVEEILCAAWIAWLRELTPEENGEDWVKRRRVTSRLTLRGVELSDFMERNFLADEQELRVGFDRILGEVRQSGDGDNGSDARPGGVVGRRELLRAMTRRTKSALVVAPILDAGQIGEASIDVRLGNGFIIVQRPGTLSIRVKPGRIEAGGEFKEHLVIPYDRRVILHPGEFMLGSTLEYLCVPPDMMAYVIGKSALGRLGLIIATAVHVAPGYKGTLTLELSNVGTVPIELHPRALIAQLVFHRLEEPVEVPYHKRGKFSYSIGPETPPLSQLT
jgi:dCTP deaminase